METLPALDGRVALAQSTIEAFRRDGHVKIPSVFTADEIEAYRPHLSRAIDAAIRDERLRSLGSEETSDSSLDVQHH